MLDVGPMEKWRTESQEENVCVEGNRKMYMHDKRRREKNPYGIFSLMRDR